LEAAEEVAAVDLAVVALVAAVAVLEDSAEEVAVAAVPVADGKVLYRGMFKQHKKSRINVFVTGFFN
jgi:hypothetical protein